MRRRFLVLSLWFATALPLAGCGTTPTLPLPPPVASVGEAKNGLVVVEGEVLPQAYVSIFNERTEGGVITRADLGGVFSAELEADTGDELTVWQERDGETGERKLIVVPGPR